MIAKAHSDVGASNSARWINCPGSVHLIRQAPPSRPSRAAAQGTVAHSVAAAKLAIKHHLPLPEKAWEGMAQVEEDGFKIEVDIEMLDAVQMYEDFISGEIEKYDLLPHQILLETPVHITGCETPEGEDGLWGTADAILVVPYVKLLVVDYKHGFRRVETSKNSQLLFYALGALLSLSDEDREDVPYVEVAICQPRADGITVLRVEKTELLEFHEELKLAAKRVLPGAAINPGVWCTYCPAAEALICPAHQQYVMTIAEVDYSTTAQVVLPDAKVLDNETLSLVLSRQSLVEAFLENVAGEVKARLERGEDVPGYKLVQKVGHRKWTDEQTVIDKLGSLVDVFSEPKLTSPNQVEKRLKAAGILTTAVSTLSYKPDLGFTVAKVTDRRQEVVKGQVTDYINVEHVITD